RCGAGVATEHNANQFTTGSTTGIIVVTDTNGNTNTCTFTVTVKDTEVPTITCPPALTDVPTDPGQCYATGVNLGAPLATNDNCGILTVTNNAPAQFPHGTTIVTWTVVDTSGNLATCTQNVTVQDHEQPTITCPPALTDVPTDPGQCYATGVNLGAPLATNDNCGILTVTNNAPAHFP